MEKSICEPRKRRKKNQKIYAICFRRNGKKKEKMISYELDDVKVLKSFFSITKNNDENNIHIWFVCFRKIIQSTFVRSNGSIGWILPNKLHEN